jgi:hypothetical protein
MTRTEAAAQREVTVTASITGADMIELCEVEDNAFKDAEAYELYKDLKGEAFGRGPDPLRGGGCRKLHEARQSQLWKDHSKSSFRSKIASPEIQHILTYAQDSKQHRLSGERLWWQTGRSALGVTRGESALIIGGVWAQHSTEFRIEK